MQILAKEFRESVRVAYFMMRKGISKGKILSHLNFMMMRGKIAGKLEAIHNLIFHHRSSASDRGSHLFFPAQLNGYKFSFSKRRKNSEVAPPNCDLVARALENIDNVAASPALPGFGQSPLVRHLRVTDSPYPLRDYDEDNHVDEAADEFITKFYKDLKRQNTLAYFG